MSPPRLLCTFSAGGLLMGLDVAEVREVLRPQELTRVPAAPAVVRGLMNLRGRIVTAIDLARRLGLRPLGDGDRPMNVVVVRGGGAVSLQVDEIGDVLEVDEALRHRPPETLPPTLRDLTVGIYRLRDRLLLVLDAERVASLPPPDHDGDE